MSDGAGYPDVRVSPSERIEAAYRRIDDVDRPEVWISLRDRSEAQREARSIEKRLGTGEELPLAGTAIAVKDNIDVAGLPTTAGCPAYAYRPSHDAPSVARLRAAGAIVLGKTNLDQFATGLVGTRSPHGAVRDVRDPARISGGSSSGSAVAVALGIADLALGTDTAGSGRVPASFQGIVGVKPTRGLISTDGVVPACRSFDCVSLFARTVRAAEPAATLLMTLEPSDHGARAWPRDARLSAPPRPTVGVPLESELGLLTPQGRQAFAEARTRLQAHEMEVVEIALAPLIETGRLLYEGALVAERFAAVGRFIAANPDDVDPTVREIVLGARSIRADQYVTDMAELDAHRCRTSETFDAFDAIVLPTAPFHPTIAEVASDPLGVNRELGTFTNFCNLLDLCGVAVPAGMADQGNFGVTVFAPAFHDVVAADIARGLEQAYESEPAASPHPRGALAPPSEVILVIGAHMSGGPLNSELTSRGARLLGSTRTTRSYRLYRLDTDPPKPGLARSGSQSSNAAQAHPSSIEGELWALSPAALGSLVAELPSPMALGRVSLEDGSAVSGFLCEPWALEDAVEITSHGGWRAYLRSGEGKAPASRPGT